MSVCLKYPSPPENEGMYFRFENFFFLKTPNPYMQKTWGSGDISPGLQYNLAKLQYKIVQFSQKIVQKKEREKKREKEREKKRERQRE